MELFIKNSGPDFLEVIDIAYPQYLFVFREIELTEENGQICVVVNKASVNKSDKAEESNPETKVEDEDTFLSTHTELIINELFRNQL
jgi:hypothetical protein